MQDHGPVTDVPQKLRRSLSVGGLTAYGIGGMLGGGIYALVGAVAAKAGHLAWVSFAVAMLVAAPTAMSYLVLASRYPKSGGEAHYVQRAFGVPRLSMVIGWLVALSGLVSMATLAVAFAGYARELVPAAPTSALVVAFLIGLGVINWRGIRLTSGINILFTLVEVSGLIVVIIAGALFVFGNGEGGTAVNSVVRVGGGTWGIIGGALLAFYAFIGFEDMVNVAEEVVEPERAYKRAIPLALVCVSCVYMAVSYLATETVPVAELAASSAPLAEVVERGIPSLSVSVFDAIALFAVANSALLNCVMASRLLYGMSHQGLMPRWLGVIHRRYRTPHRATALVVLAAMLLALTGTLTVLAGTTSTILLIVFAVTNAALLVLLGRKDSGDRDQARCPRIIPAAGVVLSLALMISAVMALIP